MKQKVWKKNIQGNSRLLSKKRKNMKQKKYIKLEKKINKLIN